MSFSGVRPRWPDPDATTALTEVLRTLRALGPAAHRVHDDLVDARRRHGPTWSPAVNTEAEDFRGRRHVVAFFYSRCDNPAKCSATVTRLSELATRLPVELPGEDVGVAAISYDPGYDTPERLAAYGAARGVPFSDSVRLFRAPTGHAVLR